MARSVEEIERELRDVTAWSQQADEFEEMAEKHANSLRRKRAKLIEELYEAKKETTE